MLIRSILYPFSDLRVLRDLRGEKAFWPIDKNSFAPAMHVLIPSISVFDNDESGCSSNYRARAPVPPCSPVPG